MSDAPVMFDADAGRRVLNATRAIERMTDDPKGAPSERSLRTWFWAKTTAGYNDTTGYAFTEQLPDNAGGWDDGTFTGTRCFDANLNKSYVVGTVLQVRQQGYDANNNPLFQCIGILPGARFEVNVTKTSGAAGTASAACSYVYTVKNQDDSKTLGTGMSPTWGRAGYGKKLVATHGVGYYEPDGTFILAQVDEEPDAGAC
jgi:hypothetical protein